MWVYRKKIPTCYYRDKSEVQLYNLFLGWQAQEWAQSPWHHWACNWKRTRLHLLLNSYAVQGSHMEREVTICIFREPQEIHPWNQDGICRLEEWEWQSWYVSEGICNTSWINISDYWSSTEYACLSMIMSMHVLCSHIDFLSGFSVALFPAPCLAFCWQLASMASKRKLAGDMWTRVDFCFICYFYVETFWYYDIYYDTYMRALA